MVPTVTTLWCDAPPQATLVVLLVLGALVTASLPLAPQAAIAPQRAEETTAVLLPSAQPAPHDLNVIRTTTMWSHMFTQLPAAPSSGVGIEDGVLGLAWKDTQGLVENETFDNGTLSKWNATPSGDAGTGVATDQGRTYAFLRGDSGAAAVILDRTDQSAFDSAVTIDFDLWVDGLTSSSGFTLQMQAAGWRHDLEFDNDSMDATAQVLDPSTPVALSVQTWMVVRLILDANGSRLFVDGIEVGTGSGSDTSFSDLPLFSINAGVTLRLDAVRLDTGHITRESLGWVGLATDLPIALGRGWSHVGLTLAQAPSVTPRSTASAGGRTRPASTSPTASPSCSFPAISHCTPMELAPIPGSLPPRSLASRIGASTSPATATPPAISVGSMPSAPSPTKMGVMLCAEQAPL